MAGMITWHELFTTDVDRAIPFYTELLGAEIETASMGDFEYQMLNEESQSEAGFVKDERGVAPSHWYPYIHSDDVDASIQAATSPRGTVDPRPDGRRRHASLRGAG